MKDAGLLSGSDSGTIAGQSLWVRQARRNLAKLQFYTISQTSSLVKWIVIIFVDDTEQRGVANTGKSREITQRI